MYDLHTHTLRSDGELLPLELLRRMAVLGYGDVAIADHVDTSTRPLVLEAGEEVAASAALYGVSFYPAVELTHVPPAEIGPLARRAKQEGAVIVVVHGETPVEPVAPGTNRAACTSDHVDVLAHPGLIAREDARAAADRGIALELTSRGGHNRANGHVARTALETGCQLVVNSDAHAPHDLMTAADRVVVARGAGLDARACREVLDLNIAEWLRSR
ncbi:MAG: histidinol phosphate phosphatase domain-containing protein [Methanospirillum sp.]|mgnify:CR=1 FL=1|nr:histidinol phosphate phosphatase domain-containing protein [Methanospirillum sp.]